MNRNDLQHYGIKGMQWGVRRKRNPATGRVSGKKTRVTSQDHKTAKRLKKKHISEMSNEELQRLNRRMQLERTHKDLKAKDISAGRKFFQDWAKEFTKNTLNNLAKDFVEGKLETLLKKEDG